VLYSHRSTMLHTYAMPLPDALGIAASDVVLPVVPMFHVNAWGLPYVAMLTGCKLVLPGSAMDGRSIYELIENEGVTRTAGVPTVWQMLLDHVHTNRLDFSTLKMAVISGAAASVSMIRAFRDKGVDARHAWGMTETSPTGTANSPKHNQ